MYLKHVEGSDVSKFKDVILASKKPRYLFELAKHTEDLAEIQIIQDLIITSGSFTYMRMFAEKIKSADIEKIERAILDTDNVEEIKKFAKYVKRSKMKKFFLVL
jgi:geranylgeranyl pyrophosphate synthase